MRYMVGVILLVCLSGCSIDETDILKAEQFCQQQGGVKTISVTGGIYCVSGKSGNADEVVLEAFNDRN